MKQQKTTNDVLDLISGKRRGSFITPPINKRIRYKGKGGLLLNDYGFGVVYFRMDGDQCISCDVKEAIEIL